MVPGSDSWSPERIREEIADRMETVRELSEALKRVYEEGPYTDPVTAATVQTRFPLTECARRLNT